MTIETLRSGWPFTLEQSVLWGEMDAFQHINNLAYFRYFENARIAFMASLGWQEIERETGVGFILASVQARFRLPLSWPDTIVVTARPVDIREDRFTLQHAVISHRRAAVATEGEGILVTFDYGRGMKVPIPDLLRQRLAAVASGTSSAQATDVPHEPGGPGASSRRG
jgi:acyl-CoA thioester hydrolase